MTITESAGAHNQTNVPDLSFVLPLDAKNANGKLASFNVAHIDSSDYLTFSPQIQSVSPFNIAFGGL